MIALPAPRPAQTGPPATPPAPTEECSPESCPTSPSPVDRPSTVLSVRHQHLLLLVLWLAAVGAHRCGGESPSDFVSGHDGPPPPPPFGQAPAARKPEPVKPDALPPGLFSSVFNETNLVFATTNLTHGPGGNSQAAFRAARIENFRQKLENGRRLRLAKLYDEATPQFTAALASDSPEEIKQAALLELALAAQEQNQWTRTLQILSQYLSRWPKDPGVPEIYLRQGLIYRQLGTHALAISKFYATMTTALVLKDDHFEYYRKLVLQAQAEIAETLALQNKHAEAAEAFARLLMEESPALNRERVQYRYIHSLAAQAKHEQTIGQAQDFLTRFGTSPEQAEVRFLLATALKKLGRNQEALQQVMRLLQSQQAVGREDPATLAYWQQRTGNEIANQLYQDGDLIRALDIYQGLALLSPLPAWRCPVQYQIGLVYERLQQPAKAYDAYTGILDAEKEVGTNAPPSLKTLIDMARWRQSFLQWQMKTELAQREIETPIVARRSTPPPAPPALTPAPAPGSPNPSPTASPASPPPPAAPGNLKL